MGRKAAIVTSPPPSQGMTPAQLETEKIQFTKPYRKPLMKWRIKKRINLICLSKPPSSPTKS